MKNKSLKLHRHLLTALSAGMLLTATLSIAQETNTPSAPEPSAAPAQTTGAAPTQTSKTDELIQQLQQRINDLEQKVNSLPTNPPAPTQAPEDVAKDKQKVQELDQQVRILQRNRELDQEAAEAKAKEAPKISLNGQGFSFGSADGDFAIQLKGVLQVDSRSFFHDGGIQGNDGFLLRRARPIMQGTVFRDFDFLFVPDFGGTTPQIFDASLTYRYSPELQLTGGKFKTPVGLEQLQADRDILFNERSLVTDLVPNRDLGFALGGDLFDGRVTYSAGIFNGVGDARNSSNVDFEDDRAVAGRLFLRPFRKSSVSWLQGLGFGAGGSYEGIQGTNTTGLPSTTGGTLPGYTTDGQQQFFAYTNSTVASGRHWRLSPQAYYYYGPFSLMGEYAFSDQQVSHVSTNLPLSTATLQNTAWQVSAGWVLTGEDAAFAGGVVPRHPFNPGRGGWGAFQVVGRYEQLHIDPDAFPIYANLLTSASAAAAWSAGLNWYLNRNVMFKVSFSHTDFQGGGGAGTTAPAAVTRQSENVLFTRLQLAF